MADFINNKTKANASLYIGMCLPSICKPDQIKDYMNAYMTQLQPLIIGTLKMPLAVGAI